MAIAFFQTLLARIRNLFGPREGLPRQMAVATVRVVPREARRPLRIVHSAPGRLVISGRLADVCAELDRLAALEAAQVLAPAR